MEQLRDTYASDSLVKLAKDLGFDGEPAHIDQANGKEDYTLALIERWLRESEHAIHIKIDWDTITYDVLVWSPDTGLGEFYKNGMFNTYEEALEESLRKGCMMLKELRNASKVLDGRT